MRDNEDSRVGSPPTPSTTDALIDTWTSHDQQSLIQAADALVPQLNTILDEFYVWLLPSENGRRFLNAARAERLKGLQYDYWQRFFKGNIDEQYKEVRTALAVVHADINLPVSAYLLAQHRMEDLFAKVLAQELREDDQFQASIAAVRKLIQIDTALTLDAYGGFVDQATTQRAAFIDAAASAINQLSLGIAPELPEAKTKEQQVIIEALSDSSRALSEFSARVQLVAEGNFEEDIEPRSENDVLGLALQTTRNSLREVSLLAESIAAGNLTRKLPIKGDQDLLANSINKMVDTLNEVSAQANRIARGDYHENIVPRSEGDSLGLALQAMTGSLREVSLLAESIAAGNLMHKLPLKGGQDLLANSINKMVDTLNEVSTQANRIAQGNYDENIVPRSEADTLGLALEAMTRTLREAAQIRRHQEWLSNGLNSLNEVMSGDQNLSDLTQALLNFLAPYLGAQTGALYLSASDRDVLVLMAGYALSGRHEAGAQFRFGEGLIGQAAQEQRILSVEDLPPQYLPIRSGLGSIESCHVIVCPLLYGDNVVAVMEFGSFAHFGTDVFEFIRLSHEGTGLALQSARAREQINELLLESQEQTKTLHDANEQLLQKTEMLVNSQEELRQQQEELEATNEELETTNQALERQQASLELANQNLEHSRVALEAQTEEVATASRYKSEFIANMSHELRTPLNSILLLANVLTENRSGNLHKDQIESAQVISNSGNDLLSLIDDILDLSKVEAGRLDLRVGDILLSKVEQRIVRNFRHVAEDKGLSLTVGVTQRAPTSIQTDPDRLDQILKNLISNAIKFTSSGEVTVTIDRAHGLDVRDQHSNAGSEFVSIDVTDTGIGIPADRQALIFDPFRQGDSGIGRNYGGTGLGLSISEKLAVTLGGQLRLTRSDSEGSTFTLSLPMVRVAGDTPLRLQTGPDAPRTDQDIRLSTGSLAATGFEDDRDTLAIGDEVVLVIEDDAQFAQLLRTECHQRKLKCLLAPTGESGLALVQTRQPMGIILDIRLPGIDGWAVLETLKDQPSTRHIPVHVVSADPAEGRAVQKGAIGFLSKPLDMAHLEQVFARLTRISRSNIKKLLIIEDDPHLRQGIVQLIGNGDVHCHEAASAGDAFVAMRSADFDCVVLDIGLPDLSGFEFLDKLVADGIDIPPVVIYTGREVTREEDERLRNYSDSVIIKGAHSQERLFDEVALFLHRVVDDMTESKRTIIRKLYNTDELLLDKKVLLVDDDMRNVFALSKLLRDRGMQIVRAENGSRALEELETHPDVDIILMDIMMPVMDGYQAIERIRASEKHSRLPIIALTAKAMKGDRDKAIALGANDYHTKPVDFTRLCSMMRIWLQG